MIYIYTYIHHKKYYGLKSFTLQSFLGIIEIYLSHKVVAGNEPALSYFLFLSAAVKIVSDFVIFALCCMDVHNAVFHHCIYLSIYTRLHILLSKTSLMF